LYNIRYGTGGKKRILPWGGYLGRTGSNLDDIIRFIHPLKPDVVGLIEVDGGSYRAGRLNQAQTIAGALGHYHAYRCKYGKGVRLVRRIPVMNQQGNAFLCRDTIAGANFHYFKKGMKRLVIEMELDHLVIFLVHLALTFNTRQRQLRDLYNLVRHVKKPLIVAGDFNVLWGEQEIDSFLAATGLLSANRTRVPTFPSWKPKRHLDFILHSPHIRPRHFAVPRVPHSDHLPLVFDFDVLNGDAAAPVPGHAHPHPKPG
jgi:endonuclease/exonuclease/phosphatase family metal-dependent hydrolase